MLLLCAGGIESNPGPMSKEQETQFNTMMTLLEKLSTEVKDVQGSLSATSSEIATLRARIDDLEGRSRRDNLVFYGITNTSNKMWKESEEKMRIMCHDNLGVTVHSEQIERAHRVGRLQESKTCPIIVKFSSYKTKEAILRNAFKLKGTALVVSEDFTTSVRNARRKLIAFGHTRGQPFRLRFNK
ncbi:protein unc-13 homolog C-like [Ornithodoros turicata]|uniref:protein unc-13 homolog C-like n=1 Tax=Ornithodoros turicata TaxID=34597 RepID=UPI003139A184